MDTYRENANLPVGHEPAQEVVAGRNPWDGACDRGVARDSGLDGLQRFGPDSRPRRSVFWPYPRRTSPNRQLWRPTLGSFVPSQYVAEPASVGSLGRSTPKPFFERGSAVADPSGDGMVRADIADADLGWGHHGTGQSKPAFGHQLCPPWPRHAARAAGFWSWVGRSNPHSACGQRPAHFKPRGGGDRVRSRSDAAGSNEATLQGIANGPRSWPPNAIFACVGASGAARRCEPDVRHDPPHHQRDRRARTDHPAAWSAAGHEDRGRCAAAAGRSWAHCTVADHRPVLGRYTQPGDRHYRITRRRRVWRLSPALYLITVGRGRAGRSLDGFGMD